MRKEIQEAVMKKMAGLNKKADGFSDWVMTGYTPLINGVGGIAGAFDEPADEKERAEMDRNSVRTMIPGVAGWRTQRRLKGVTTDDKGSSKHYWSQTFGPLTSTGGTALLAGLLGLGGMALYNKGKNMPDMAGKSFGEKLKAFAKAPIINPDNNVDSSKGWSSPAEDDLERLAGAGAIGGLTGLGGGMLANLGGAIGAGFTKRRTAEEQKEYTNKGTAKEYLIPGQATYNNWKSLGRVFGDSEERVADKGKDSEKDDKKDKEDKKEDKNEKKASLTASSIHPAALLLSTYKA
jgi:hypothetical protein